ncbi:MAG: PilZ domain-containing protein [Proteobacteria bacterium]|nr:PilZ domain-containing protein [Pseudomonadota bacterium]
MEQRTEARVDFNVRFFVHVHESEKEPDMVGLSLECEAIDFSAQGMQFSTNSLLSPGALVNVSIGVGEPFSMYLLRAQVRWLRPKDDAYYMGVMLLSEDETDLEQWVERFTTLASDHAGRQVD